MDEPLTVDNLIAWTDRRNKEVGRANDMEALAAELAQYEENERRAIYARADELARQAYEDD